MTGIVSTERQRGIALTGWLLFMLFSNGWTIYRYVVIIEDYLSHADPRWETLGPYFVTLTGLAAINLIAVGLLWFWRIVGLYLFIAVSLTTFAINLVLGLGIPAAVLGLTGAVITYLLVQQKREMFR